MSSLDVLSNSPIEHIHPFKIELYVLVMTNHRFAVEGVDRAEDEEKSGCFDHFAEDDSEVLSAALSQTERYNEELRQAANQLALVGIVTRLQHWIGRLSKRAGGPQSNLLKQLRYSVRLGVMGMSEDFLNEIVNIRDS